MKKLTFVIFIIFALSCANTRKQVGSVSDRGKTDNEKAVSFNKKDKAQNDNNQIDAPQKSLKAKGGAIKKQNITKAPPVSNMPAVASKSSIQKEPNIKSNNKEDDYDTEEEVAEHISGSATSYKKKKKKAKKHKEIITPVKQKTETGHRTPALPVKNDDAASETTLHAADSPPPNSEDNQLKDELYRGKTVSLSNIKIAGQNQDVPNKLLEGKAKFVVLNFEDADIRDVITVVADLLKINYIIDGAVSGTITIHTSEKIHIADAFPIFRQILALNGVSLIKSGRLYKFMPAKELLREPIETYIGRDKSTIPDLDKIIFQIIPLNYIPASTLQGILVPLLTKNGMFMEVPGLNRLFLIETATNIRRIIDIINSLDMNMFEKVQVKLYEVKHADSEKLISELQEIFSSLGYSSGMKEVLRFINLPRLKSILIINAFPRLYPTIDYWIKKLDISTKNVELRLLPVKYIGGSDFGKLIGELKTIFGALGYQKTSGSKGDGDGHVLDFVPISRLNSILVINSYPGLFDNIAEWLERLDQPLTGEDVMKVYVHYVQNSDARNIAGILNQLFSKEWTKREEKIKRENDIFAFSEKKAGANEGKTKDTKGKGKNTVVKPADRVTKEIMLNTDVEGEVNVIADSATNSLIIRTNPRNYPIIVDTIKKLDIMPMQVLIEVIVAEVQLDGSNRYGLEWAIKKTGSTRFGGSSTGGGNIANPSALSLGSSGIAGLSFFVHKSDELLGLLQAFSRESKLEILSSPMLLTSENKTASINIVNQIPIESTTVDPSSNTTRTSIQFKDVGIKLSVTPKISRNKYVNLDINQEVSQVSDITTGISTPAIFSRQTQTNVFVKNKQSLVIAGLMEKRDNRSKAGIPGIFKLPFLGCLFGNKAVSILKTELLIFITPHVISNTADGSDTTLEFRNKLKSLNLLLKKGFRN